MNDDKLTETKSTPVPLNDLLAGLSYVRAAPANQGVVEAIVVRPESEKRVSPEACEVSAELGVHGDHWAKGCWRSLPDGSPAPEVQIALMSARVASLISPDRRRWPLAGDNLIVDLDLSEQSLPVGRRIAIGEVVLEITAVPHTGCRKFSERFGSDAVKFVNSSEGKSLRLRGVFGRVVEPGSIRTGDAIRKL